MVTDLIGDLIIRLKNASDAKKPTVEMPYSKYAENVVEALKKSGYVESVSTTGKLYNRVLQIGLLYHEISGARIHGVDRISKPSRRIYQKSGDIRTYRSGFGNTFFSTPKGIMADGEARKQKVGGEVLFKIW